MGVGFLKANISTVVGQLYPQGDPRRDPGFTLYYYGINLGAFWASILVRPAGRQTIGWWAGFGLAGVGMLAGFVVFVLGKPLAAGQGRAARAGQAEGQPVVGPINREWLIYGRASLGGRPGLVPGAVHTRWSAPLLIAGMRPLAGLHPVVRLRASASKVERERLLLATGAGVGRGGVLDPVRTGRLVAEPVRGHQRQPRPCCRIRCRWLGGAVVLGAPGATGRGGDRARPASCGSTLRSTPPRPRRSTPAAS